MQVKVIGCQCHKYKTLKHSLRVMARRHGWPIEIETINDPAALHAYGDLPMPALMIDGELVSVGKALHPEDLEALWMVSRD